MGVFFNPPPVAGPIPFDSSFSEFFLGRVGDVADLPLDKLERGLARHNFRRASGQARQCLAIVVCDQAGPEVQARVEELKASGKEPILVLATACKDPSADPWEALSWGAEDFLLWRGLEESVEAVAARLRRWREVQLAVESLSGQGVVVGRSRVWRSALAGLVESARFATAPVLIIGETGTGKELLAHCVHALDPRPDKGELVLVDGAALNPELSGSELFGHERGAFTGAVARREGALARAHGGTLFLDEVGDITAGLQGQLLRAVQEGVFKPVGGDRWAESRFRLVCATNRDLTKLVQSGSFRRDLFHRLAGCVCPVPPLRDRREDIPLLVERFVAGCCSDQPPPVDRPVADFLTRRDYPGNVRELKQLVARLMSRHPGRGPLTIASIPLSERPLARRRRVGGEEAAFEAAVGAALARGKGLEEIRKSAARTAYWIVLSEEQGDTGRAAERLKVSTRAVQMFLKKSR